MKVIKEQIKSLCGILGAQAKDEIKMYRMISFCVLTEVDGCHVAYNSLTGEVLELTEREAALLRKKHSPFCEEAAELIEKWFLVPVDHDDIQLSDEILAFAKLFQKNEGINKYVIFTTMDCNARCFYCYEMGRPRIPMTEQTAKDVLEFICKNAPASKRIEFRWFGGEPLYNSKVIDIITGGLAERGREFLSTMVSNGFLFDEELVKRAKEKWNLKKVQITLDGKEELYNKVKAFIDADGKNPFVIVTDNIERLINADIHVDIRLNVGEHNKDELFSLVNWLAERYKGDKKPAIYASLLYDYNKEETDMSKRMAATENMLLLERKIRDLGFGLDSMVKGKVHCNHCAADLDSAATILPNGKIVKCEHYTEDSFVGDIYTGITDHETVARFKERANTAALCEGCTAYPVCIKLKVCPGTGNVVCNQGQRLIKEEHLKVSVQNTYRKLKEKENKAE